MALHRFKLGDVVILANTYNKPSPARYEVVRLLPSDSQAPAYRIKSKAEQYERAVREHEITPGT